jgi:Arc/MetJ family transcription regulator
MQAIRLSVFSIYNVWQEDVLKTTVEMDPQLLEKARKILGTATIKETVEESLRRVLYQNALRELADSLGTFDIDLNPRKLRAMRRKRSRALSN